MSGLFTAVLVMPEAIPDRRLWHHRPRGPSALKINDQGFQRVQNRRLHHSRPSNANIVSIESNRFQIVKTKSLGGTLFHIIERRPHLSRSIIIPLSALHWLRKTLVEAAHLLRLSQPYWRLTNGWAKFWATRFSPMSMVCSSDYKSSHR